MSEDRGSAASDDRPSGCSGAALTTFLCAWYEPVRTGRSLRHPKKRRDVAPKYPDVPPGTVGRGMWLGEALINNSGKIAHVLPTREVEFMPPFPAFNRAITAAIQQWEFERCSSNPALGM
jgi:hypothetical protein